MEIQAILKELERCRSVFPSEAVGEAIAQREEITPELLRILAKVVDDPAPYAADGAYFSHIFALFLLAKFHENRAYPLVIRIASIPGETVFDLLGDVVTENLGRILASVSGGDADPLKSLIENEDANEFARSAAMRALVTLVATGQRSRKEAMEYFAGLFHRLEREPSYVWSALANHCADLCPLEVQNEIQQAYEDELIEPRAVHPDDVRDALKLGEEAALKQLPRHGYRLIDDIEKEMSWMSGFQAAHGRVEPLPERGCASPILQALGPYRRPGAKVGRNDPCPCGSGRKFKKCCGQ